MDRVNSAGVVSDFFFKPASMYTFGMTAELTAVMGLVYEGAYTWTVATLQQTQFKVSQKGHQRVEII
jgi:hypothetical protein